MPSFASCGSVSLVPPHEPPLHLSFNVHWSPSLQLTPLFSDQLLVLDDVLHL